MPVIAFRIARALADSAMPRRRPSNLVCMPLLFGILALAAPLALGQSAGGYDLHWNVTTANGGGAMTGANGYTMTGTIGQPVAGPSTAMTVASDSIVGGFWSVHANDVIFRTGFE
ncbi:hypothetical protein ELE36_06140 [Pseudolysobacter antarcticus]|uniref:Uncharacterized protein n=1 Tax=Pseudolysobacter antarcticus TaxID=2511995 RepID=A0A411HHU3_9GAMM|nr:hypothetical protein [Pseudolysobacter antarcticus]QBB69974.1 hypothetical protein ELE36_06140 [Pseudolysobacter antarcticus]